MSWALRQQAGGPAEKLTLLLLSDCVDVDGFVDVDMDQLAAKTEQAPDRVECVIRGLVDRRLLIPRGGSYLMAIPDGEL